MMTLGERRAQLAEADKRRKHREALTAAHEVAEAEVASRCGPRGRCDDQPLAGEDSRKAIAGLQGAEPGPGVFGEPGKIAPEDFRRGYLDDSGHAAPSPMAGPPTQNPMPPLDRGALTPVELPGVPVLAGHDGPVVQALAAHQGRAAATMPRMPVPRGSA